MYYVYLLESKQSRYIGYTNDLKRRLKEHNSGQGTFTKRNLDWEIVFYEAYPNSEDARRRENYLKTTQGKQALKRMLKIHYRNKVSSAERGSTT